MVAISFIQTAEGKLLFEQFYLGIHLRALLLQVLSVWRSLSPSASLFLTWISHATWVFMLSLVS